MRILKTKIALSQASRARNQSFLNTSSHLQGDVQSSPPQNPCGNAFSLKKRKRVPGISFTPETSRATKNISKNYGKAICTFAASYVAIPYLRPHLERESILLGDFVQYITKIKTKIDGLYNFRSILLDDRNDTLDVTKYKRLFKVISEVFIKYFSVNWIFNSKIFHKEAHLRFRYKTLRRIQSPELFTYIKRQDKTPKQK